jgi:hypothetical protein
LILSNYLHISNNKVNFLNITLHDIEKMNPAALLFPWLGWAGLGWAGL